MDGCQGAAVGPLLGLRGARAVGTFGTRENAAGGEDEDVAVGKLLLEFAGQAMREGVSGCGGKGVGFGDVPLLDFVEAGEKGNGDEYDDCFFAVADFDL